MLENDIILVHNFKGAWDMLAKRKRELSLFIVLIFVFSILLSSFVVADRAGYDKKSSRPYKDGEIIVKFKDDVQAGQMSSFSSGKGLRLKKSFENDGIEVYELRKGMSVDSAVKSLMKSGLVEYAQPNYIYKPLIVPSDSRYNELWGFNNRGQTILGQAGEEGIDIKAPEAWDITTGRDDIVVAVIDEGIYIDHPDLKDNIWVNTDEIPGNGIDDDGNGYIDDVNGWDFYNGDKTVFDERDGDTHGTHVAGTIAASANDIGVIGVAPNVKIMPLKFLGPNGLGYTSDAVAAIKYAAANGADIVNCSWGGDPGKSKDEALENAIKESGLLFVFAAGNNNNDNDNKPVYPASSECENIISVGAVDNRGNKADFSNYGSLSVDIGAPGWGILSTMPSIGGTAAITVTDAVYGYKAFYSSFDISDFIVENDKLDFIEKVVSNRVMDLNVNDKILVVDDDETDMEGLDTCKVYLDILHRLGFLNITESNDVMKYADGPLYEDMKAYGAVIWLTGKAFGNPKQGITTLTENDQSNIIRYLEDNKKFILIGEDALLGIEDSRLFKEYLKIDDCMEFGINEEVKWNDEPFQGKSYDIIENQWRDIIIHTSEYVKPVMEYVPVVHPYSYMQGTSMAAPHVSGIATLLLSKNPDLTPAQIKAAIMDTVKPLKSLEGKTVAGGMADAFAALKAIAPQKPSNLKASKSGSSVTLTWGGVKAGDFEKYIIERKTGSGSYAEFLKTKDNSFTDSGLASDTRYTYKIKAIDKWGNASASEIIVDTSAATPTPGGNSNGSGSGGSGGSGGRSSGGGGGGGGGGSSVSTAATEAKPTDSLDEDIAKQLNNSSDIVDVKAHGSSDIQSASISFDILSKLTKLQKRLNIRGNDVIFDIPPAAFETDELKDYLSSKTSIFNIKALKLSSEEVKKLLGAKELAAIDGKMFDFTASAKDGSKNKKIESFNKKIKVSIKLDSKDVDKYGRNKLGVYRFDEKAKRWDYAGGVYDSFNNTITFMTDHFSKYAVMAYTKDFEDSKNHWAKDDIDILIFKHIAEGRNDKFEPDEYITREELVKMLVKVLMQAPHRNIRLSDAASVSFKDVSVIGEDRLYIGAAVQEGIITGLSDGTFRPEKPVSREEMAAMIARMINIKPEFDVSETAFKDKEQISAWAAKDVAAAYEKGIMTGDGEGNFSGKKYVTRAEAAVMVRRIMESMGLIDLPSMASGKLVISDIEGRHYELETSEGIYVLIADEKDRATDKMLGNMVGKEIKVKGYFQSGFNIYQRGRMFKVISIE